MPQDAITEINLKVQKHEMQLSGMERMMNEGLIEQRQLVRELHEMTSSFKVYIERHDQVSKSNEKVWAVVSEQSQHITALREQAAENQPVINAIRTLNNKIIWLVVSALATPAAIVAYIASTGAA